MLGDSQITSVRDRVLLLRAMPNLSTVDEHSLTSMVEHSKLRRFQAGELLLRGGAPIDAVYMIVHGKVRIEREGRFVSEIGRNAAVGLLSIIARDPMGIEAKAIEPTLTLEIPIEVIQTNLHTNFAIVSNAVRLLTRQVLQMRGGLPAAPDPSRPLDMGTWRKDELTLVERLMQLRQTPFGARANLDALAELARCAHEVRFAAGDVLWSHGDVSDHWVRVDYGRAKCETPDGRSVTIGANYSIGVFDSLAAVPRAFTVTAETPIIALRTNLLDQMAVMENHVPLASEMTAMLARTVLGIQPNDQARPSIAAESASKA